MANSNINISINAQDNASVSINNTTNALSKMRQNIDMAAHSLQAYTLGLEALKNQLIPLATAGVSANTQNLELLLELIGIENFAKLAENCGGMSFYIPKMPSKKLSILRDIKLLKELEVSKDDIIKRLAKKYELSHRTLRRIYDRS